MLWSFGELDRRQCAGRSAYIIKSNSAIGELIANEVILSAFGKRGVGYYNRARQTLNARAHESMIASSIIIVRIHAFKRPPGALSYLFQGRMEHFGLRRVEG